MPITHHLQLAHLCLQAPRSSKTTQGPTRPSVDGRHRGCRSPGGRFRCWAVQTNSQDLDWQGSLASKSIPPGKDRWLATPIGLGLSWPRKLIHRTWEWLAIYFHRGVVGGWTAHFKHMCKSNCIHLPQFLGVKIKKCLKPSPGNATFTTPQSLTKKIWKLMVGRRLPFLLGVGNFSGASC